MAAEIHQTMLMQQRQAVLRAIHRAREARADRDAEILQSVVTLIEELHDLAPFAFNNIKPTTH